MWTKCFLVHILIAFSIFTSLYQSRHLAKHHIEFENIHPFVDGNGRTGRLLLIYEMILLELLPVDVRYEERDRYYAAISSYRDKEKYSTHPERKTEGVVKLFWNNSTWSSCPLSASSSLCLQSACNLPHTLSSFRGLA